MSEVTLCTAINFVRPASICEQALAKLSHYFYLGGQQAFVIKNDEVRLENGQIDCYTIALKIASYVLLAPITLILFAVDLALRSQHHFTLIKTPNPESTAKPTPPENPLKKERQLRVEDDQPTVLAQPLASVTTQTSSSTMPAKTATQDAMNPPSSMTELTTSAAKLQKRVIPPAPYFEPFSVKINDKPYSIHSIEEMQRCAQELGKEVFDKHTQTRLDISPWGRMFKIFLAEIRKHADVIETRWHDIFDIIPKKTEESQDGLTIRKYANGVVEKVSSVDERAWEDWKGCRIYPNGIIEDGGFRSFKLSHGTQVEKGTTTYFSPDRLVGNYGLGRHLMYATVHGKKSLIVIGNKPGSKEYSWQYIQVHEELIPAIANILKSTGNSSEKAIHEVFSSINFKEFVEYLFTSYAIFELHATPLQIILKVIQKQGLPVNLHLQQPSSQKTLLQLYVDNPRIVKALLAADPTLIQRKEGVETSFVCALLEGSQKGATLILKAMDEAGMVLIERETLFKRIAFSEGAVAVEQLRALNERDQRIAFQLANMYTHFTVIQSFRPLGLGRQEPLLRSEGPSIFAYNMDALEMHEHLRAFLKGLRSKGLLLKNSEFTKPQREKHIRKERDIGRILGRDYIENKARELGLKHVKVPKKIIVMDDDAPLGLVLDPNLGIRVYSQNAKIYAQRINASDRAIRLEEVTELLRLFEATGYSDIHWGNIIIGEDGVYIIDTEFTNFWVHQFYFEKGRQYGEMAKIIHALPKEQQQPLIDELNKKIEGYQKQEEELTAAKKQRAQLEREALKKTGCLCPAFTYSTAELFEQA